ncbi:Uncharacterised protein [Yersinia aldovae]|uniref:Uncharacterized protein n=1 Tax=Yersinia aldovae TaxID=29483 RepID=A0A0T9UWY0_YERAL|nr:Uncharacterised protein [Yersinia aldovae]
MPAVRAENSSIDGVDANLAELRYLSVSTPRYLRQS